MNVFKRALVQVRGNLGKSILVFIIFLMTMAAISATFMISRMYNITLVEAFKDGNVPVYVVPETSRSIAGAVGAFTSEDSEPQITLEQYEEISKLDGVMSTEMSISYELKQGQFDVPAEFSEDYAGSVDVNYISEPEKLAPTLSKDAYKFEYDIEAFNSDPNSIILSKKIFEENNYAVSDKVILNLNSMYSETDPKLELVDQEVTIVGTYEVTPTQQMIDEETESAAMFGVEPDLEFTYLNSQTIMPFAKGEEVVSLFADDQDAIFIDVVYKLSSMDTLKPFEEDIEALIEMPVDVEFNILGDAESEMANALNIVAIFKVILTIIITIVVVIIVILLIVIITLFVRGRKKEIGIMVALGENKRNIYFQLLIEQFIILTLAIIVEYPFMLMTMNSIANENGFLALGFDLIPFGQTLLAGMVIIGIITIIPAIYTLRVNPKKILL